MDLVASELAASLLEQLDGQVLFCLLIDISFDIQQFVPFLEALRWDFRCPRCRKG